MFPSKSRSGKGIAPLPGDNHKSAPTRGRPGGVWGWRRERERRAGAGGTGKAVVDASFSPRRRRASELVDTSSANAGRCLRGFLRLLGHKERRPLRRGHSGGGTAKREGLATAGE